MHLYEVYINNGLYFPDEEHFTEIVVAENEEDALNRIKNKNVSYFTDYDCCWWDIKKLDSIDGYDIIVKEKDNKYFKCTTVVNVESDLKEQMYRAILKGYRELKLEPIDIDVKGKWYIKCR